MSIFHKDRDFWGNTVYRNDDGDEIGYMEETWLGNPAVYKDGKQIADIQRDFNGNEELIIKSNSIFESDIILKDKDYHDDWWFSEESDNPDDDGDDF